MDPRGIATALAQMKEETKAQPEEIRETTTSATASERPSDGGIRSEDLFDDDVPISEPNEESTPSPRARPLLDAPAPETQPSSGSTTVS